MPGRKHPVSTLISAEHASNRVPARWRDLFRGHEVLLETHRAWDPGSRTLARALSRTLKAPLLEGRVTRLLVDLNRSSNHPGHFSKFTRPLPEVERAILRERYWTPHWRAFREQIDRAPGAVIHIACHSFTPALDGTLRDADLGLLYDPSRKREKAWCRLLADSIRQREPGLKIRMNYPYRGSSNGMGQQHRPIYPDGRLVTIEIELNQALVGRPDWPRRLSSLAAATRDAAMAFGVEDW